jgi:hypothetical protein
MRDTVTLKRRTMLGQEEGATKPPTAFQPFIDKVGVPLLWFGIGYLAATLIQKPRRVSA